MTVSSRLRRRPVLREWPRDWQKVVLKVVLKELQKAVLQE